MRIESNKANVNFGSEKVYNYLMDLNNFQYLLPQGKFSDWEGSEDRCAFKIQGYKISLEKLGSTPNDQINLKSGSDSPIDFTLDINIDGSDKNAQVFFDCNAKVNPFLKMMIQKPLTNLFEYMTDRTSKVDM